MPACRGCGAAIRFEVTAKGNRSPISEATGESHFIDCPQAARFKRPKLPKDECLACGSKDIDRLPGVGPHAGAIRCRDCHTHRWLRKVSVPE